MKLDPATQDWMSSKAAQKVLAALPEGSTRFVGGCVRNAILGEAVNDIDLATQLRPDDVIAHLEKADIRTVPTGIEHGTVTAVVGKTPIEITTLRKDVETDGRRAVIAFTEYWAEDAQRRDFTVNALYAGSDGTIYDPCGEGIADIKTRTFRFVGSADDRVQEDYLRILRYFRFIAWYSGGGKIDAEALRACRENRGGLKQLSAERIWSELKKLLRAPSPERAVRIMQTNEVLETLLPEASNAEGLELMVALERDQGLELDPLIRLMAMAARDEFAVAGLCKRMKVSRDEKTRFLSWAGDRTSLSLDMSEKEKMIAVYNAGAQTMIDRATVRAAGSADPMLAARWTGLARFAENWERPEFPLRGRDLKAAGIKDGPDMGKTLRALEALWIRSGFTADRDKLLMALKLFQQN